MIKKINELSSFILSEYFAEEESRSALRKTKTKTKTKKNYEAKRSAIENAKILYDNTGIMINAFEITDILPGDLGKDVYLGKKTESVESIAERTKMRAQKSDELNKMITEKDEIINRDLFKKYFQFQSLSDMQNNLSKTQNVQKK